MVIRSRVLPSKCTRRYGAICALCFDTPIELRPGSTITDGDETKGGDSTIFSLNLTLTLDNFPINLKKIRDIFMII